MLSAGTRRGAPLRFGRPATRATGDGLWVYERSPDAVGLRGGECDRFRVRFCSPEWVLKVRALSAGVSRSRINFIVLECDPLYSRGGARY